MEGNLIIVARILAKKDKADFVKSELLKLIEKTRKEKGNIQYSLHSDNENPALFLFYEKWENRILWQKHMNNNHIIEYMKAVEDSIESFTLNEMSIIK